MRPFTHECGGTPDAGFVNAAPLFVDEPMMEGHGDRTAFVTPAGRTTYAELHELTDRTANGLRALGVEPEHRVAIAMPDGVGFAATFFAALKLGAVAVPVNTRLADSRYRELFHDARVRVLVTTPDLPAARASEGTGVRATTTFEDLVRAAPAHVKAEPVGPDAMAFWLYTSGTTGLPKAAVHCHRDLVAGHAYGVDVVGYRSDDRVFATSRLFFAYALANGFVLPLAVRASVYLSPAWPDAALVRQVALDYRPTIFVSVPTMYGRLLRADLPRDTFASTRLCTSAGERLPADIYEAWRERFGVEILDGMGSTETIFMLLSNRPGASRAGSSGRPVPGTEVRLLDADGRDVPDGAEGVLYAKSASVSPAYWNRIDVSRRAFVGEWFRTGDIYLRDADGFYHHRGRADEFFKVAGQWVVPADVETLLTSHPGVSEAGVAGAEDTAGLVKAFAFVVPKPGIGADVLIGELTALAEANLPPHARPRRILVVDDLPRTATGKLQRFLLKERVQN